MKPMKALSCHPETLKYSRLLGIGGIGTGMFFHLKDNHTLGRNESRLAELVPYNDYCKLHIISHYVAVLLGAGRDSLFKAWPVGRVGEDDKGQQLIEEMAQVGMFVDHVKRTPGTSTMFSVCFQYPDSTGGNITTMNSACEKLSEKDVETAHSSLLKGKGKQSIVLAAPEVPIRSRLRWLELAKEEGAFTAASVLTSEIEEFERGGGFQLTDYLAINIDEAKAVAGIDDETMSSKEVATACVERLVQLNQGMKISITDGPNGSFGYENNAIQYFPSLKVDVKGTGGAGDAFFAGVLAGISCGLPFLKEDVICGEGPGEKSFDSAMELGTMVGSCSVTSGDTIHRSLDAAFLGNFARKKGIRFSRPFSDLFK